MKICVVTGPFLPIPPGPAGAVERVWRDLAVEFVHENHEVTMISADHPALKKESFPFKLLVAKGYHNSGKIAVNLAKDLIYSFRILRKIPRSSEIIVTNCFFLPMLISYFSQITGKVVPNIQRVPKGQMKFYKKTAAIATVSSAMEKFIAEEYPPIAAKTRVVPNPIATGIFAPPKQERDFSTNRVLTYTGRIHPEKGIGLLIEAAKLLFEKRELDLKIQVIGPHKVESGGGGERYYEELRKKAEGLPITFHVAIHDRQELATVLQKSHFHCYPSLARKGESFGVAPLEAMGCGCIAIVSALQVFTDFVKAGETGFVFQHEGPEGPANLAGLLEELLDKGNEECLRISRQSSAIAKEYSNENVSRRYLALFEELLSGHGPQS